MIYIVIGCTVIGGTCGYSVGKFNEGVALGFGVGMVWIGILKYLGGGK